MHIRTHKICLSAYSSVYLYSICRSLFTFVHLCVHLGVARQDQVDGRPDEPFREGLRGEQGESWGEFFSPGGPFVNNQDGCHLRASKIHLSEPQHILHLSFISFLVHVWDIEVVYIGFEPLLVSFGREIHLFLSRSQWKR